MHKLRLPLIALVALVPAIASAQDAPRPDRGGRFEARGDRPAPPQGQPAPGPDRAQWQGRGDRGPDADRRDGDGQFARGGDFRPGGPDRAQPAGPGPNRFDDRRAQWDGRNRGPGGDRRPGWDDRRGWNDRNAYAGRPNWNNGRGWDDRRGWNDRGGWNDGRGYAGWRNDRRYDWQGWRSQNRALFRGPRYVAPRGYGYRPFSVGYRLDPFFYSQSYWLADPWQYRLPPAEGPYRWVRYFDDVLLVDLRTGTIVDSINQFFW